MYEPRNATLGEAIFSKIDKNQYLQELYETILFNYSMKLLREEHRNKPINRDHILRFADILSKSSGNKNTEKHKTWAQEIVALLNAIYPNDAKIKAYASSVLANIGNYRGLELIKTKYKNTSFLDDLYSNFDLEYLSIPHQVDKHFFHSQKEIYGHLEDMSFSYSGPTSMGKSLIMRMFIKDKILKRFKGNFAILVPTKALITEISSGIVNDDLKDDLAKNNYKVVNSGNSMFLKQSGLNYIMVVTPERMLYMLMSYPSISVDYLFIDEAHKINESDGRSAFYYKVTDMLAQRDRKPHVILASPNIPNPQEFFSALPDESRENETHLSTSFTPVSQMKYVIDLIKGEFSIFNERCPNRKNAFVKIEEIKEEDYFPVIKQIINLDPSKSNIIYCNGKDRTVELARSYAANIDPLNDPKLDELAKEIKEEIHDDYYLADLIRKGVAYHVGYLPLHIRTTIEESYKNGLIKTVFCTSTLIEGVNLPADNLFVISYQRGGSNMTPIEFKNLLGRVGRIKYNLYGNVFIIRYSKHQSVDTIKKMLEGEVPEQKISLEKDIDATQKKYIVGCLVEGNAKFSPLPDQSNESYDLMRKIGLILLRDITKDRNSVVRKQFAEYLDDNTISMVKEHFATTAPDKPKPDDDINVSVDQTQKLIISIKNGLKYPDLINDRVEYNSLVGFLKKLSIIFNWPLYESETIGRGNSIEYYAVILTNWMNGQGLRQILTNSMKHKLDYHLTVMQNGRPIPYEDTQEHRNLLIGETLGIIENVILFSIANYFLRFSTEYKKLVTNGQLFDNDWYEYVEFGSTNELTIFFQRYELSRDTADYIREHKDRYVIKTQQGYKLKKDVLSCGKKSVEDELNEKQYNVPELFI